MRQRRPDYDKRTITISRQIIVASKLEASSLQHVYLEAFVASLRCDNPRLRIVNENRLSLRVISTEPIGSKELLEAHMILMQVSGVQSDSWSHQAGSTICPFQSFRPEQPVRYGRESKQQHCPVRYSRV